MTQIVKICNYVKIKFYQYFPTISKTNKAGHKRTFCTDCVFLFWIWYFGKCRNVCTYCVLAFWDWVFW